MNEILLLSYYEHMKREDELALVFPMHHPKRVALRKEIAEMYKQMKQKDEFQRN